MNQTPEFGGLTPRERQALDVIVRHVTMKRIAPSHAELADALGVRSKANITRLCQQLERKGRIRRISKGARGIALVAGGGNPDGYVLTPDLEAKLQAYCRGRDETPAAVVHDAVVLFLDAEVGS